MNHRLFSVMVCGEVEDELCAGFVEVSETCEVQMMLDRSHRDLMVLVQI